MVHAVKASLPSDIALLPDLEESAEPMGDARTPVSKVDGLTIVLPALNEEKGVEFVLNELIEVGYITMLVIDGHSSDGTIEAAKRLGVEVLIQPETGKADAIRTAVYHAKTPFLLIMDADATYDPRHINRMIEYGAEYDEVIGVRADGRENIPAFNRLGNWVITKAFNLLFGTDLRDVCSGMYLLRTEVAKEIDFDNRGFSVEVEVAAHVASTSRLIRDVEVSYRPRIGKPKLRSLQGLSIMLSIFKLTLRYNPVLLILTTSSLLSIPSLSILGWVAYELLVKGINHFVWAMIGVTGTGVGILSFLLSMMTLYVKRMEYRLLEKMRRLSKNHELLSPGLGRPDS